MNSNDSGRAQLEGLLSTMGIWSVWFQVGLAVVFFGLLFVGFGVAFSDRADRLDSEFAEREARRLEKTRMAMVFLSPRSHEALARHDETTR